MSLTRFQYECLTCSDVFTAVRQLPMARCASCGSMHTQFVRMSSQDPPARPAQAAAELLPARAPSEDEVSKFVCLDCGRPFRWNHTRRPNEGPTCLGCSSASVKEVSPRVTAFAVARGQLPRPKRELSKAQIKRLKSLRRQWRMRCDLQDQISALDNLLVRMGFEGEKIARARETMAHLLVEVDAKQLARIHEYEQLVNR